MRLSRREFLEAASTAASLTVVAPSAGTAATDEDPLGVRADFPVTRDGTYLNSAYIAPNPLSVAEAGRAFADAKASRPISLGAMQAKADEVRGQFARLVNASPEEIGFLYTTSEGENLVAGSLDLKSGDNIVIDRLHYQAEFVLYGHLAKTKGVELRIVEPRDGAVGVEDFEPMVNGKTRLVSVAWVSHQNGFRHDMRPLADLAHAHHAYFYTDAIQAAGMFPIDVKAAGVDFLASGTYKWLLGSFGVAPFYIRRELLEKVRNDRWGALHVEKELGTNEFQIFQSAKKYEYATSAFGPIYQLGAGLAYLDKVGVDRIEAHTIPLAQQLRQGLVDRKFTVLTPAGNRSSIVTFLHGKASQAVQKMFEQANVQVTIRGEKGAQVRVSPALFNTKADVERLLQITEQLT